MKQVQCTLFSDIEDPVLSIADAAKKTGVSSATIRNWIKTGYLELRRKGFVDLKSLDQFIEEVAGREKLNSRANKSLKDSHDHAELEATILKQLSYDNCTESLGEEYELALSNSHKNKEGVYYTPSLIVNDLFRIPASDTSLRTFCDPCCGSGNFIIRALDLGFSPENLYGYDTDPVAVAITKQRIYKRTGYQSNNVIQKDFLYFATQTKNVAFDFIFTNPPWGKKLQKDKKRFYGKFFHAGKSLDTSALFFFACLGCLKEFGRLGLLLPESFFNISTFEDARAKALTLSLHSLIDYGKAFKGLVTKAQAIVLDKKKPFNNSYQVVCKTGGERFYRSAKTFAKNPKHIFNFHCNKNDSDVISQIFSIPHITLKQRAKWGLGIVTGNNKKFCKEKLEEGYMPVYKGADIKASRLKEASYFIPADLSLYQQVAPIELFQSPEKLIYKFISSNLCFFYDTEKRFILNSANMLIPSCEFPISGRQLCDMLNSNLINWLFRSLFNTHKILRGDLEYLPIHTEYFLTNSKFNEELYLEFLGIEKVNNRTYRI
ncbi:TaqI-like C-terminal specificity domain-containing protein [Anaerolineales bacterium HSG25]|nr:TaqI-like C-terminal specificity domain-containing protein [Anaerolineales bacterium HSG25]